MRQLEKRLSVFISLLLHPLAITTIGMFILLNSGSSLSVLQPEIKRITLIITLLFTMVFPVSMIILLYLTGSIQNLDLRDSKERVLPMALTIVLYMFTFFLLRGIPQLSGGHIVYLFSPPAVLFVLLIINNFIKPSIHMAGMGMMLAILLVLILFYGTALDGLFMLFAFFAGLAGTARLILKVHDVRELLAGFFSGFLLTIAVFTIYLF